MSKLLFGILKADCVVETVLIGLQWLNRVFGELRSRNPMNYFSEERLPERRPDACDPGKNKPKGSGHMFFSEYPLIDPLPGSCAVDEKLVAVAPRGIMDTHLH